MRAWIGARHSTSSHIAKRTARAVVLTVEKPHHGRGALLPAVEPRPPSTLPRTFRFRQLRNLHHPLHTTLASSTSDASIPHNVICLAHDSQNAFSISFQGELLNERIYMTSGKQRRFNSDSISQKLPDTLTTNSFFQNKKSENLTSHFNSKSPNKKRQEPTKNDRPNLPQTPRQLHRHRLPAQHGAPGTPLAHHHGRRVRHAD